MEAHIIFVFIILVVYIFFSILLPESKRNVNIFISILILILIIQSTLRHLGVGSDTYAYYLDFEKVKLISWDDIFMNFRYVYVYGDGKDAGYPLLQKIFQIFFGSFRLFLLFVAIVFFRSISKLLKKFIYTYRSALLAISLYLMLFYSFFSITGIRQTIAVAMSIFAFLALLEKKWVSYILYTIIAFFIHKSAAILLIFPLLLYTFNTRKIIFLSLLGFVFSISFRGTLMSIFREAAEYDTSSMSMPIKLMALFFILALFIYYTAFKVKNNASYHTVIKVFSVAFMWIPLLGWDSLFMREILYFSIYYLILVPVSLENYKRGFSQLVAIMLIIFAFVLFVMTSGEYKFLWQNMSLPSYVNYV